MATYLDFEKRVKELEHEIEGAKIKGDEEAVSILKNELQKVVEKTYKNLSNYQKLQLARHPDRPYALDYMKALMQDKVEIFGDRCFRDDPAIIVFIGYIEGQRSMVIAEQKGRGTKNKIKRNFGMPHPEGYRKALRAAKMAEKFNIPILMLIDTPGAYPGIGAEERGQSEAIAKNLFEFSKLKTITISIVIGEGGSGGALAIGVADRLAMMRYSVFSVISPEGCAAILWDDPAKVQQATNALKITAYDLKKHNLIDDIVSEPQIGAHRDKEGAFKAVKDYYLQTLNQLKKMSFQERLEARYKKLLDKGSFKEKKDI